MKKYLSSLILLLAAAIWGFAFAAQKAASNVAPFTLGAARSIIATAFLIAIIPISDKISGSGRKLFSKEKKIDVTLTEIIAGIFCGTALTLATFFQQAGINAGTDAGKTSFITALYVVLVPIYSLALKKRAPVNVWISVLIAAVGFYFLCIKDGFTIVASDALVIVCAFLFPIQIIGIAHFSPRCDGIRFSAVQFLTCTVLNLILALITESPIALDAVFSAILPIIFLGIGSSGIAYTLQIIGQRGLNPAVASIIMSLESVFGVLGAAIFLGEKMSGREYLGCAIVFLAVVLSQIEFKTQKSKQQFT